MNLDHKKIEHIKRLKKLGWTFILLGLFCSIVIYFLPNDQTNYWLSHDGKQGFYVISILFGFLGIYCLKAIKDFQP